MHRMTRNLVHRIVRNKAAEKAKQSPHSPQQSPQGAGTPNSVGPMASGPVATSASNNAPGSDSAQNGSSYSINGILGIHHSNPEKVKREGDRAACISEIPSPKAASKLTMSNPINPKGAEGNSFPHLVAERAGGVHTTVNTVNTVVLGSDSLAANGFIPLSNFRDYRAGEIQLRYALRSISHLSGLTEHVKRTLYALPTARTRFALRSWRRKLSDLPQPRLTLQTFASEDVAFAAQESPGSRERFYHVLAGSRYRCPETGPAMENGMIVNGDPEQKRSTFTPDQLEALEQAFNRGHYPTDPFNRDNMSNKVDLSQTRVQQDVKPSISCSTTSVAMTDTAPHLPTGHYPVAVPATTPPSAPSNSAPSPPGSAKSSEPPPSPTATTTTTTTAATSNSGSLTVLQPVGSASLGGYPLSTHAGSGTPSFGQYTSQGVLAGLPQSAVTPGRDMRDMNSTLPGYPPHAPPSNLSGQTGYPSNTMATGLVPPIVLPSASNSYSSASTMSGETVSYIHVTLQTAKLFYAVNQSMVSISY
ncbi:ARX [Branchiostoma lanceolatum]|uniref:ARX protein n=1 Tax=Branchiostoma lanceolatum TaxID=7740 RepID=A0A8K0EFA9_BRALA|nr:ARX [Branchiostoma lanceolatum]